MNIPTTSRWQQFRSSEDAIPTTYYEAGVFLQNARLHLMTYGISTIEARLELNDAHKRVNDGYIASFLEVA